MGERARIADVSVPNLPPQPSRRRRPAQAAGPAGGAGPAAGGGDLPRLQGLMGGRSSPPLAGLLAEQGFVAVRFVSPGRRHAAGDERVTDTAAFRRQHPQCRGRGSAARARGGGRRRDWRRADRRRAPRPLRSQPGRCGGDPGGLATAMERKHPQPWSPGRRSRASIATPPTKSAAGVRPASCRWSTRAPASSWPSAVRCSTTSRKARQHQPRHPGDRAPPARGAGALAHRARRSGRDGPRRPRRRRWTPTPRTPTSCCSYPAPTTPSAPGIPSAGPAPALIQALNATQTWFRRYL